MILPGNSAHLFLTALPQCRKIAYVVSCYWWHQTSIFVCQVWCTLPSTSLGVFLSYFTQALLKLKYLLRCMKNLKLHEIRIFIAYGPENQGEQRNTPRIDWCQLMWGDSKGVMLRERYHLPSFMLRRKPWHKVTHLLLILPHRSVLLQNAYGQTLLQNYATVSTALPYWTSG